MVDISTLKYDFLFLQGSASNFFSELGAALQARGHRVYKVNFNGGDAAFWHMPDAVDYKGDLLDWPLFLAEYVQKRAITDIVLLGDCRPLHMCAIKVATALGIQVHVFEEGYLRPNWITLERGGVNAYSSLGRDPQWFLDAARDLPPWTDAAPAPNHMTRRAVEDILYVVATGLARRRFPHYQTHRPWSSWVEYAGGARRMVRKPWAKRRLTETLNALSREAKPYYLFPLQLEADSQIRLHSKFGGIRPAIEMVIASFAAFAPAESRLIITEHPLDTCPFDWRQIVAEIAEGHRVNDRVFFFEGGSPERTILGCRGVITVNSTLGYLTLSLGKPLIALGTAIYGISQLTFQHGIDRFWREGAPPDSIIFDAFRRVVAARTQVNGSFYSKPGLQLAVEGSIARLETARRRVSAALRADDQPAPCPTSSEVDGRHFYPAPEHRAAL